MGQWISAYQKSWFRDDLVAGLTAAAVVIPQAMAYAAVASLPLVIGLYTAFVSLIVYALMGTSRPLSVTTTSTIAILTAGAFQRAGIDTNSGALIPAAVTLTFLVGVVLLLASVFRLGFVANFISQPVLVGFKAGIGLVIILDQLPRLLGVHFTKGNFFHNISSILARLPSASGPTIALAAAMLALLIGLQKFFPHAPASLMTVLAGIAVSTFGGLNRFGIELVGEVQRGLPSFSMPAGSLCEQLWPAAIGIALMSFVETIAAGQAFRTDGEPRPQPNRELLALGLANLVGGFFQNMPSGGGTSQTAVNRRAGARTQVAALVTAAAVVTLLLFLAPWVHLMPQATLAAVVVVPCAGMIRLQEFRTILKTRFMEFSWGIAALVGVVLLGTLRGILVAVVLSLLVLIYHANARPVFVLGRKPGTEVFRPLSPEHPEDETFPGLLLLKTEGVISFANAQRVGTLMMKLIEENRPRVVIIDCSAIPDFEYTALAMLADADGKLRQSGISLWLAALNPEPLQLFQKSTLAKTLGHERMFFNVEQAVGNFLRLSSQAAC